MVFCVFWSCWEVLHTRNHPPSAEDPEVLAVLFPARFPRVLLALLLIPLGGRATSCLHSPAKASPPKGGEPVNVLSLKSQHKCQHFRRETHTPTRGPWVIWSFPVLLFIFLPGDKCHLRVRLWAQAAAAFLTTHPNQQRLSRWFTMT